MKRAAIYKMLFHGAIVVCMATTAIKYWTIDPPAALFSAVWATLFAANVVLFWFFEYRNAGVECDLVFIKMHVPDNSKDPQGAAAKADDLELGQLHGGTTFSAVVQLPPEVVEDLKAAWEKPQVLPLFVVRLMEGEEKK